MNAPKPKWTSWSAHFAWGALLVLAFAAPLSSWWAWVTSVGAGIVWEVAGNVVADWKISVVDACIWTLGSCVGLLWWVFVC